MKPSQIHHAFEQATAHFSAELAVAARHIYRSARQKAEADWGETPEADDALGATRRYLFEQFVAELGLQSGHRVSKVKFPKTTRTYRALTVEGFEISVHRNSSYFGMPASNLRGFQGVFNHGLLDLFAQDTEGMAPEDTVEIDLAGTVYCHILHGSLANNPLELGSLVAYFPGANGLQLCDPIDLLRLEHAKARPVAPRPTTTVIKRPAVRVKGVEGGSA
jgi:hypothetical protein